MGKFEATARTFLFVLNFILFLCGVTMVSLGIWAAINSKSFSTEIMSFLHALNLTSSQKMNATTAASVIFIIIGTLLLLIGFLGCWGTSNESTCSLMIFCIIIGIIILAEFSAGIGLLVSKNKIQKYLKNKIKEQFQKPSKAVKEAFATIQRRLNCCGVDGPSDYPHLPPSCRSNLGRTYSTGCWTTVRNVISRKTKGIVIAAAVTIVIEIVSLILGLIVYFEMKRVQNELAGATIVGSSMII
ncbi:hypothetical protein SNEBB_009678 [Seison nebaliae]|nr:hypothetical protein SNEBB_009678 [Seison nebaliae]